MSSVVEDLLRRIAGARVGNPALLSALELAGAQLPAVAAASVQVLDVSNAEIVGGGSILLRSPFAWATWTIEESRDSIGESVQVARTGPFCTDVVYVSSATTVKATVARYWEPALDPIVDPLTGVVTSQTPDPALTVRRALQAWYLPGVHPSQLRRAAFSTYFASVIPARVPVPADAPAVAAGSSVLAYPVDLYRRALVRSVAALTWDVTVPDAGALAGWPAVSAPAAATAETLLPGAWGAVRATNAGAATNASILWET